MLKDPQSEKGKALLKQLLDLTARHNCRRYDVIWGRKFSKQATEIATFNNRL